MHLVDSQEKTWKNPTLKQLLIDWLLPENLENYFQSGGPFICNCRFQYIQNVNRHLSTHSKDQSDSARSEMYTLNALLLVFTIIISTVKRWKQVLSTTNEPREENDLLHRGKLPNGAQIVSIRIAGKMNKSVSIDIHPCFSWIQIEW